MELKKIEYEEEGCGIEYAIFGDLCYFTVYFDDGIDPDECDLPRDIFTMIPNEEGFDPRGMRFFEILRDHCVLFLEEDEYCLVQMQADWELVYLDDAHDEGIWELQTEIQSANARCHPFVETVFGLTGMQCTEFPVD